VRIVVSKISARSRGAMTAMIALQNDGYRFIPW